MGSGAAATLAAPVSDVWSGALTMTNNGKGYNTLPTVSLSDDGNPGTITGLIITNAGSGYILQAQQQEVVAVVLVQKQW